MWSALFSAGSCCQLGTQLNIHVSPFPPPSLPGAKPGSSTSVNKCGFESLGVYLGHEILQAMGRCFEKVLDRVTSSHLGKISIKIQALFIFRCDISKGERSGILQRRN